MHTSDPILGLMDRFTAALNAHDLDAVLALVTEDIVFESTSPPPDGARYEGRDGGSARSGETCWPIDAEGPVRRRGTVLRRLRARRGALALRLGRGARARRGHRPGPRWPARRKPGLRQGIARQHSRPRRPAGASCSAACRAEDHANGRSRGPPGSAFSETRVRE